VRSKPFVRAAALAAALAVAAAPLSSQDAPKPRIDVLRIETRGPDVFLKFHLTGALNPELSKKIEAGLETAIRYEIRLYRRYRYWFDTYIDTRRYRVAATYDPVAREYVVEETLDKKLLKRTTTRDFAEVQRMLVARESLLAFRVADDMPHHTLYATMQARFDAGFLFAFIPVDGKTDWKKSQVFDVAEPNRVHPDRAPKAP
jgi:Domain of unknown function (DUF4390)